MPANVPYSRLIRQATATSSGAGAATFTFPTVEPEMVWTGSVFIDGAPAAASSRVTVSGVPWGTTPGGTALTVEGISGDTIQMTTTGLANNTSYTAWMIGKAANQLVAAGVGYSNPFPGTTH